MKSPMQPIDVPCVECGAAAGQRCVRVVNGRPRSAAHPGFHLSRQLLSRSAHVACPLRLCGAPPGRPCISVADFPGARFPQARVHRSRVSKARAWAVAS